MAPNNSSSSRSCARPEGVVSRVPAAGFSEAIDAWRAEGADGFEPVRFRLIEAMARRAQACSGTARAVLDDKVATLLATHVEAFEQARGQAAAPLVSTPAPGPLTQLLDHIAQHNPPANAHPMGSAAARPTGAPAELKAVQQFRSTWTRLSADQRLTQALAKVPDNAGPLNSQRLLHRSLALMRELSPDYLERFVSYVDALLWLDDVAGSSASNTPSKAAPRAEPTKKRARGKTA